MGALIMFASWYNHLYIAQISTIQKRVSISQKNMTAPNTDNAGNNCPAEALLKTLSGKWKPQIFKLATAGPLRFNTLLRQLEGSNKQSLAVALKELTDASILDKNILQHKPLHVAYSLTEKGKLMIPIFLELENLL